MELKGSRLKNGEEGWKGLHDHIAVIKEKKRESIKKKGGN